MESFTNSNFCVATKMKSVTATGDMYANLVKRFAKTVWKSFILKVMEFGKMMVQESIDVHK